MKPICVPCQRFFRPKRNGFAFIEGMPKGDARPQPGTADPAAWQPYKLWRGDLWECLGCGAEVVVGVAGAPVAEHYQSTFAAAVSSMQPEVQINDC